MRNNNIILCKLNKQNYKRIPTILNHTFNNTKFMFIIDTKYECGKANYRTNINK